MKFVSDKQPKDWAERFQKLSQEITKRKAALRELEKEAEQLEAFLLKVNKGKSWQFNGALYQKQVSVRSRHRLVLDQDKCKKLLKSKTPYKQLDFTHVTVDYVYEDGK